MCVLIYFLYLSQISRFLHKILGFSRVPGAKINSRLFMGFKEQWEPCMAHIMGLHLVTYKMATHMLQCSTNGHGWSLYRITCSNRQTYILHAQAPFIQQIILIILFYMLYIKIVINIKINYWTYPHYHFWHSAKTIGVHLFFHFTSLAIQFIKKYILFF